LSIQSVQSSACLSLNLGRDTVLSQEATVLYSIVVGLIAGWLTGQVMKGGGYGVLIDIVLGLLGGVIGGWLFGALGIWPGSGVVGSIVVSFVGAVILVALTRMLRRA
jgi:uncharacterized membrane protein YeaQ/YmgE (transglycosylase-associated protein family)